MRGKVRGSEGREFERGGGGKMVREGGKDNLKRPRSWPRKQAPLDMPLGTEPAAGVGRAEEKLLLQLPIPK